jgi:hypothetical protein
MYGITATGHGCATRVSGGDACHNPNVYSGAGCDVVNGVKYFLILLLLCLAAVEFFFHLHQGHSHHNGAADKPTQAQQARELLKHHLYGHH